MMHWILSKTKGSKEKPGIIVSVNVSNTSLSKGSSVSCFSVSDSCSFSSSFCDSSYIVNKKHVFFNDIIAVDHQTEKFYYDSRLNPALKIFLICQETKIAILLE